MRTIAVVLAAASAASVAFAQPHGHQHRHAHPVKRDVTVTRNVPGPTVFVYELNGEDIPIDQVCQGIGAGELKWADGISPPDACTSTEGSWTSAAATTTTTTTTAAAAATSTSAWTSDSAATTSAGAEFYQWPSHHSDAWSSSSSPPPPPPPPAAVSTSPSYSPPAAETSAPWPAQPSSAPSTGTGIGAPFPDGQIDCSTFPSAYGAVPIDYLGMGGWTGLQALTIVGGAVVNIVTGISGQSCTEGMMCSYACPPGFQKSQWPPNTQGATGQSVGGLSCSGGKLHLTNSGLSTSLCVPGVGGVQATNNAGSVVSICRTDYPGTESETIPTVLQAGETQPLTCPDAGSYYMWQGKSTSAQYYLNPPGYGASDACQWGSPGRPLGNYAPINFGVGAKDGTTWLSIMANTPTTNAVYPGTVEIVGNISGSCKYMNGQYCSANGCNSAGCTVSLISGTATYVIT